MALTSILFKNCRELQACAVKNSAHVTPGARGEHVARIQKALNLLEEARLDLDGIYGSARHCHVAREVAVPLAAR